ncbi:MAG: pyridoxamine 5'-phosphate oxidase family protein [Actinomycetota bacterium]
MHETAADLERLQQVLDRSRAQAGAHLRGIFDGSGMYRPLSAEDLAARLTGVRHVALATVTGGGEPRVAPTDGLFFRGMLHVSLPGSSFRLRHLKARPAVSATHFVGEEIAVWMHGRAELMQEGHPDFDGVDAYCMEIYGSSATTWGSDIYYVRLEPDRMFAYEGSS